MFELSYTKTKTYLNCPWLYKLKVIDNLKAPPSPEAAMGIAVHKALELFHKKRSKTLDELQEALDRVWERAGYTSPEQELGFYDKARLVLKTYFEEIASSWEGETIEAEKQFFLDLPSIDVRLQGLMDRIDAMPDGSYALIDYKTHSAAWSQERLSQDLQITLYEKAAREALGFSPVRLYFFFVAQGKCVEVSRLQDQWVTAEATLKEVKEKIQRGDFSPNTTFCAYCEMNRTCQYSICRQK